MWNPNPDWIDSFEYVLKKHIRQLPETTEAYHFAKEKHEGQYRSPRKLEVPYFTHPRDVAYTAMLHLYMSMGICSKLDQIMAACLLHDVPEDCGVSCAELPVGNETRDVVRLLTKNTTQKRGYNLDDYYEAIRQDPEASLIKCIDRCCNLREAAMGFRIPKLLNYIRETEDVFPALIEKSAGYTFPKILLGQEMFGHIHTIKTLMDRLELRDDTEYFSKQWRPKNDSWN